LNLVQITMPKRVLVTGKEGQLGRSIEAFARQYPQYDFEFVGREELDLSSTENISNFFADQVFDAIINCAAYTAVDKAEEDAELADIINHLAVKQLAEIAKQQECIFIQISTDYVFNGQGFKPYIETDSTEPKSVYGASKLKGEQSIQNIKPKGCIIRTSWVYSEYGQNFVKTMQKLGNERDELNVIYDQVGSPTYAGDLAQVVMAVLEKLSNKHLVEEIPANGSIADSDVQNNLIYHYSNEGVCSWYDFAKEIFAQSDIQCQVNPIETTDYPTPAKRPHYSLLNKAKIKQDFKITIPYWKDSLKICIQRLQEQQ